MGIWLLIQDVLLQIEEHLGLQVPFTAIFQYPTLRKLAAHILHLLRTPESAPICALQDADTGAHPSDCSCLSLLWLIS